MTTILEACGNAVRGVIVARKGHKLIAGDLSNIEGRCAAWLAGEQWKLDAFAAFDRREGADLYCVSYGRAFNVHPEDVGNPSLERQIGKVMELMLQYQGGVGAFITGAETYGIDLDDLAARAPVPDSYREEAEGFLRWTIKEKRSTFDLAENTFIVCDALKRMWRAQHPQIVSIWDALQDAFATATRNEGKTVRVGAMLIRRDGAWLRIRLPSGNYLCYPSPMVDAKEQLSYKGVNQYNRQWSSIKTYGGRLFENLCQSLARDVMAANMPAIEEAGYSIILTVHDEVVTEPPDRPEFSAEGLSRLMSTNPPWAEGLPLAAGSFEAYRYGKH